MKKSRSAAGRRWRCSLSFDDFWSQALWKFFYYSLRPGELLDVPNYRWLLLHWKAMTQMKLSEVARMIKQYKSLTDLSWLAFNKWNCKMQINHRKGVAIDDKNLVQCRFWDARVLNIILIKSKEVSSWDLRICIEPINCSGRIRKTKTEQRPI